MAVKATYFQDGIGHGFECSGPGCGGDRVVDDEDGPVILQPDEHAGDERVAGFISRGWPTKKAAQARFAQHKAEHETEEAAPDQAVLFVEVTEGEDAAAELLDRLENTGVAK